MKGTPKNQKVKDERMTFIAERIRELRLKKGYNSYENFAWDHDFNRVQYFRLEQGENFTMKTLLKLVDVHKITLKEFFKSI